MVTVTLTDRECFILRGALKKEIRTRQRAYDKIYNKYSIVAQEKENWLNNMKQLLNQIPKNNEHLYKTELKRMNHPSQHYGPNGAR